MCNFREEEAIKLDGLNVAQMKELRDKAEKHAFQAEVDRMMKLIINSLYKNKEVSNLIGSNLQLQQIPPDIQKVFTIAEISSKGTHFFYKDKR